MNSRPSIKQWNNWHVILFHKQFKSNYWIEVSVHIQEFVLSTLILAATMSQCSNKPYSRMSISPRIRGMRSIFVISGQIFLKWLLALRAVSGNYPRLDTGDHLIETIHVFKVQLWPDPDAKPKSANNHHQRTQFLRYVPNINLFIIYALNLRVSFAFCNHICTYQKGFFHAIPVNHHACKTVHNQRCPYSVDIGKELTSAQ